MLSMIKTFSRGPSSHYHTVMAALALLAENVLVKKTPVAEVASGLNTKLHKCPAMRPKIIRHAPIGGTVILHIITGLARRFL